MSKPIYFGWVGSQENFVDYPSVEEFGNVVAGRYGGNSSAGQYKNEDGCLLLTDALKDWEFVILLDAHNTAESAELIVREFEQKKQEIIDLLALKPEQAFKSLEAWVLKLFQSEAFLTECRKVTGETACLILVRKGKYIWWFSVGDCLLFLHHEELAALGQYQVNQRHFYEWIGQVNTFDTPVPCYSTGRKELRKGMNHLLLTTDGLTECPGEPFTDPQKLFQVFSNNSHQDGVRALLEGIQENNVRDSTTILSWMVEISEAAALPSNL
jgi:serine/threonine protein phosphatase PrpC